MYLPSAISSSPTVKTGANEKVGVFLGYVMQPGHKWNGEYYVADLKSFVGKVLRDDARPRECKVPIDTTTTVEKPAIIKFPLKEAYDYQNRTLAGLSGSLGTLSGGNCPDMPIPPSKDKDDDNEDPWVCNAGKYCKYLCDGA